MFKFVWFNLFLFCNVALSICQTIPSDPNHLPKKIGADDRPDTIIVSGKIVLEGFPAGQPKPPIYVAVYLKGRFVARKQASENGSYTVNEVPREGSTIIVEINQTEVASRQLNYTPASAVYQDFSVNWTQFMGSKDKTGIVSVASTYERSRENQERLDHAVADIGKGKNDSAITLLQSIVKGDPKDFYAWVQLGNAYFLKKDNKNAESSYQNAIAERPSFTLGLINLGKLYLSQNDNERAVTTLTKAVELEPTSADAQHYLGEAYLSIKKGSKAVIYLNEAIRLAPIEKAEVHLRLAALYNAAGLKRRASAEYEKFLEKTPDYPKRDELKKYIAENPPEK